MPATPTWRVRPCQDRDVPAVHGLIHELAAYEREPDAVEATTDDLRLALFADPPLLHGLVAELDSPPGGTDGSADDGLADDGLADDGPTIAGMALWFVSYSSWRGRHGIWLEDLFVRPSARGLGLGRALLAALAAETVSRGYARLEWNVLDWNTPALDFYTSLGAEPLADWTVHRVTGGALHTLAERDGRQG